MELPEALAEELRRAFPGPHEREPAGLRRDIEDELADHLACSMARERANGLDDRQARAAAIERFGNPRAVARKLWFLAMKEHIMRDRLIVAVNILLAVVIIMAAVMVWRISEQSRQSNLALVSALDKIAAGRSAPAVNNMTSLVLTAVNNSDGKPAAGRIMIRGKAFSESDDNLFQNLDASGQTKFGPIRPGPYTCYLNTAGESEALNFHAEKQFVLYAGEQREQSLVFPDMTTATAIVNLKLPEEVKSAPFAYRLRLEGEPITVNGLTWNREVRTVLVTASGHVYQVSENADYNLNTETKINRLPVLTGPVRIGAVGLYRYDKKHDRYSGEKNYGYQPGEIPKFTIQPGVNGIDVPLPAKLLDQVYLKTALNEAQLTEDSSDPELFQMIQGRVQRIVPMQKTWNIMKPNKEFDWGFGSCVIRNRDGGVRALLDWPEIPASDIKPNYKYLLAIHSVNTQNNFKTEMEAKDAVIASEITAEWSETINWDQQPPVSKEHSVKFDFVNRTGWITFDLTPIVQAQAKSGQPGHGVMLHFADETASSTLKNWSGYQFPSRTSPHHSRLKPLLVVVGE